MPAASFTPATPAFALPPAITPGAYMRECRKASGRSVEECAADVALAVHDRRRAARDLAALEADRPGEYGRLATLLSRKRAFAFDFGTFATLAAATCDPSLDEWAEI